MKHSIKIVAVLTLVCCICALVLSVVFSLAEDKLEENKKSAIERAIFNITFACNKIEKEEIEDKTIYKLFDLSNTLVGYGFLGEGQGYQGKIILISVIDKSLQKLIGIEIIESKETPGLGARINENSFKNQFKNLKVSPKIEATKKDILDKNQIRAITGATISSQAVVKILNDRISELRRILK